MRPHAGYAWPIRVATVLVSTVLILANYPASAQPNKQILDRAEAYKQPVLKLLEVLVNTDSGSGDDKGLNAVAETIVRELKALGARVETLKPAEPAKGTNVVATWTGAGRGKILLIGHMDTVFQPGEAAKRPFRIANGRAYGPGVMDDKGGIVLGLYTLKILQDLNFKDFAQITLVLNSNEEIGSPGSRILIEDLSRQHDVALNLEPGRPADGLVVFRKGSGVITLEVKGKSAHAGVAPESGRNAAMEVAHQILQLGKLGHQEKGTTVNFTVLNAGTATNIIPDSAEARGDVRVSAPEEFDRVERDLSAVSQAKLIPDTDIKVSLARNFPPMAKNAGTDALAAKAQAIYAEIGRKLTLEGSGGAADVSFAAGVGTPSLDGLGIVGGEIHTPNEYAEVESIVPRFYLLTRLIMELGPGPR
jgi:glutamate carboxypeptidase